MLAERSLLEVEIVDTDFDVATEYELLCRSAPNSGAVVFFVGLVRDLYDDKKESDSIEYLELSHYAGMTERLCQTIIDEARIKFPFDAVRLIHRVGKIYAHEQIVMVAVASRHRDNAFQASRYIMDYLKTKATLWKKEVGTRGQYWVATKQKDYDAEQRWKE